MIEVNNPTGNLVIITITGQVRVEDYERTLVPRLHEISEEQGGLRALIVIDEGFEGYDLGAAWDDAKLGAEMWSFWERCALATDVAWIRTSMRAFAPLFRCPVKLFPLAEVEDARRWLEESLGTVHFEMTEGVLHLRVIGELESRIYDELGARIDDALAGGDGARLVIDVREFTGWHGIGAFGHHLSLIFGHRNVIERAALLGDAKWQKALSRVAGRVIRGKTSYFTDEAEARAWAAS